MELAKKSYRELRRRRVLKVPDTTKPIFVSGVQLRTKRFSWSKPCLLVVTATAVFLLDVQSQGELEARDGSHASIQLAVRASEVVNVLLIPGGLRLEYKSPGALKVSPSVFGFGPSTTNATTAFAAAAASSTGGAGGSTAGGGLGGLQGAGSSASLRARAYGSSDGNFARLAAAAAAASASAPSSGGAGGDGESAEAVHQVDHCSLGFDDNETARSAAAAIAYARAVDADASRWLSCGLPTNFSIELACAMFDNACNAAAPSLPAPAGAALGAGGAGVAVGPGPWGATLPLPEAWCDLLSRAEAAAAAAAAAAACASPASAGRAGHQHCDGALLSPSRRVSRTQSIPGLVRDLMHPQQQPNQPAGAGPGGAGAHGGVRGAPAGPAALVVYFSTPLGMAAARVRPEHLVALQQDPALGEVLAVPVAASAAGGGGGGGYPQAPLGLLGSERSFTEATSASLPAPCFHHRVSAVILPKESGAAAEYPGAGGVEVAHSQSVYAVLHISLSKLPAPFAGGPPEPAAVPEQEQQQQQQLVEAKQQRRHSKTGHKQQKQSFLDKQRSQKQRSLLAGQQPQDQQQLTWPEYLSRLARTAVPVLLVLLVQRVLLTSDTQAASLGLRDLIGELLSLPPGGLLAAAALALLAAAALERLGTPAGALCSNAGGAAVAAAAAQLAPSHGARAVGANEAADHSDHSAFTTSAEVVVLDPAGAAAAPGTAVLPPPEHLAPLAVPGPGAAAAAPASSVSDVWTVIISGASLFTQPDAYVQSQIKDYKVAAAAAAAAAKHAAEAAAAGRAGAWAGGASGEEDADDEASSEDDAEALAERLAASEAARRLLPMLLSTPEPSWVTPDIHKSHTPGDAQPPHSRCRTPRESSPLQTPTGRHPPGRNPCPRPNPRFIQAKSTIKASQDQALMTHKWRARLGVDTILERAPGPWYEFINQHFRVYVTTVSPEGDVVLLVKMADMKRLADAVRAGKGTLRDLEEYLAFVNEYMYKVASPNPLPGGLGVQVIDCAGARLSMIGTDTISAFKVFAAFGVYYPERMSKAIVINAPSWFDMPWRIASAILDENTRSKVILEYDQRKVLDALEDVFGDDKVPVEYGGTCPTPLDQYPEMIKMDAFVRELRAGGNPYTRVKKATPQP